MRSSRSRAARRIQADPGSLAAALDAQLHFLLPELELSHHLLFGPGLDVRVLSGTDGRYGASGWEVPVAANAAQYNTYTARIEDGFGNPLSPDQRIRFTDDCTLNVATVTFTHYQ